MDNFKEYIKRTRGKELRKLFLKAICYLEEKERALDLGAGALNESEHLLNIGFKKVVAVDRTEDLEIINSINNNNLIFEKKDIVDYNFVDNSFDFVNAQFVLFFVEKDKIKKLIEDIKKSLKKGGIFAGQFLGPKDSWAKRSDIFLYQEKEVRDFFSDLEIIYFEEEKKDKKVCVGDEKHWHIFHFIVKK